MDEKPNSNNEEKPLNNNGFSSVSNHQDKIDNLDDSSKRNLQNDQNNQFNKQNILRNTNPQANNSNLSNDMQQKLENNKRLDNNKFLADNSENYNNSSIDDIEENSGGFRNTLNKIRHPIKSILGLGNKNNQTTDESPDVINASKKIFKIVPSLSGILTMLLPIIILIVLIATLVMPITLVVEEVKSFGATALEKIGNFFSFNGFKDNHELQVEFYERVDKITTNYPEINRDSLLGVTYYGFLSPEDFLDTLDEEKEDEDDEIDFAEMKENVLSIANQMVYSTVVFDNNIIKTEDVVEEKDKSGNVIKTKKKVYKCASATYTISTSQKELCDERGVAVYTNGPGSLDFSTADYCVDNTSDSNISNYLSDPEFDKDMKCVTINYETNTDNSTKKFENFLKYVLLPDTYFNADDLFSDGYSWDKMISRFSPIVISSDSSNYNVPAHMVGQDVDYYSKLEYKEQSKVDDSIRIIMALVNTSKYMKNSNNKYHIAGEASLPLDFTIKDTPEETIKSRISGGSVGLYGLRIHPVNGVPAFHHGVDFSKNTSADPVYSVLDGVVISAIDSNIGCGINVTIGHDIDGDGKYNYYTRYCHLASRLVSTGDTVKNGQQIGVMGSTGTSTGTHLHFEWHDESNNSQDPIPPLVSIASDSASYKIKDNTLVEDKQNLENNFNYLISGNSKTRKGVTITAKFLIDNLSTLPYFCGGYTSNLIDSNWFNDEVVTDSSCSNYNSTSKYGLGTNGFVSWVLVQSGFANRYYTTDELLSLGDSINMSDSRVQIGDIAYNNNKIGVIVELNDANAVVVSMDTDGLKASTINRKVISSLFPKVVSMDNFYKR